MRDLSPRPVVAAEAAAAAWALGSWLGCGVGVEDRRFACEHSGRVAGVEDVDGDLFNVAGAPAAAGWLHDEDVGEDGVLLAVWSGDELHGFAGVDTGRADQVGG